MKNLYMITLGGKAKNATIEVHDLQFIIAEDIEETYTVLKENWYGIELKLHLDAYKIVTGADGYRIEITDKEVDNGGYNLFLVNLGGYDKNLLSELHKQVLIVSSDTITAKKKAIDNYAKGYEQAHVDNIYMVKNCKLLNKISSGNISLVKSDEDYNLKPDWFGYKRLDTL